MIKFKDQSEKKVNRLVWILGCSKYCLKNMKTKTRNKDQPTNNQKVKNNKVKALGIITLTTDQYPSNGQMGDTDPQFCMPC